MNIKRVGSAAGTTSCTIPAHQTGDFILIFAFRDGSTTNPTIPSGFTNLTNTLDGTTCSVSIGYKFAVTNAETSGTWTNASRIVCVVYRFVDFNNPISAVASSVGTTNTVTFNARSVTNKGSAWIVAFVGHRSVDTTLETAPTDLTNFKNDVDATAEASGHDSNGVYDKGDWPSTNVSITGTASGWISAVFEIRPSTLVFNNYHAPFASKDNNGIISFGERIK